MNNRHLLAVIITVFLVSTVFVHTAQSQVPTKKDYIVMFKNIIDEEAIRKYGTPKRNLDIIDGAVTELTEEEANALADQGIEVFQAMEMKMLLDVSVPLISADDVQNKGFDGTGVKVCVLDTGVDDDHDYLNPVVAEYDFVNEDNDATDDHGHGTHVAGIIASTHPTYGGVAPGASIMAAKVLDADGSGWDYDVIEGIEWCVQNGADVLSLSLGGGIFTGTCDYVPISAAVNNAVDQGVIVVVAAGNDGYAGMNAPGCASKAISVGAIDDNKNVPLWSSKGTELDIVAPGVNIISTYKGNSLAYGSGTSMATPHVSGVVAQLLDFNPNAPIRDIRIATERTADPIDTCERLVCYKGSCYTVKGTQYCDHTVRGWGIVNAYKAYLYVKSTVKDSDGDGTLDSVDLCPDERGTESCSGCPEPTCSGCQSPYCQGEGIMPVCIDDNSLCVAANAGGTCTDGSCSFLCNPGFGDCDGNWNNGCEINLWADQNNCGNCGNACQEIVCNQQDGCGVGPCEGDEYGSYPPVQQQTCIQGICEGECVPECVYDQSCDQDDDDDGFPDSEDACPQTFGKDCNGCPDPCEGCAVMECTGAGAPVCVPGNVCDYTLCEEDACGAGSCAENEMGTYQSVPNQCIVNGNLGTCENNPCGLTCEYSAMCEPNVMHIRSIGMTTLVNWYSWPPNSERRRAVATVEVVNALGEPVNKAIVRGTWSGLTQDMDAAWTNSEGKATIYSNWATNPSGTFTLTVDIITKTGWTYDSGSNSETSGSITV
ncbi:MAG: S8 family peptidase [Candidatus Aenigmarchaeota archaeon]|nr:S8 family peptidase [Candidatus Aenigmarchaeota archaeon]